MKYSLKKISGQLLKPWFRNYYSIPRQFEYEDIQVTIMPGIFPPNHTFSTRILLKHLANLNLEGKSLLELGCGSGIISLYASKKGCHVTASDINECALAELEQGAIRNQLKLRTVKSDLFDDLNDHQFDYIIINPPYYPKAPVTIEEHAWYCGEDFEYFKKLFGQLPPYVDSGSKVIIILSEDCDIDEIRNIAGKNNLELSLISSVKNIWERNYLFRIKGDINK